MARMTEHPADGGDPAGDIEEEDALDDAVGLLTAGDVRMHLGEARDQVLASAIHRGGTGGHLYTVRRTDRDDPVAAHDDGLVVERCRSRSMGMTVTSTKAVARS